MPAIHTLYSGTAPMIQSPFMAVLCGLFFGFVLAVGSNAVTSALSNQCAYFEYYFRNGASVASVALPSLLPTPISSACLAAYRATNSSALCKAECRSLYSAISECESPSLADDFSAQYCGRVNNSYCSALKDGGLVSAIYSNCGYAPASASCSSSCKSSIAALQNFSGCCRAYILNSAKLQCGQQTIAPCSSVFNSGPVVVPKDECTNFRMYGPNS